MVDFNLSSFGVVKFLGFLPKLLRAPRENIAILTNIVKMCWRFYIKKDKKYNFAVNRRIMEHTIYPSGTLITTTKYSITMIGGGRFETERYFKSDNNELDIDGCRKVDMTRFSTIYRELNEHIKENRFNDYLIIAAQSTQGGDTSRFIPKIIKQTQEKIRYSIEYTHLKIFQTFEFYIYISIPREFDRTNSIDRLNIEPIYGVFEFYSKVDKQRKYSAMYAPRLINNNKEVTGKPIKSLFYYGDTWKLYNPKETMLEAK